jgi:hypothetical protein
MSSISIHVPRVSQGVSELDLEADLERVRKLARLLDAQFTIAGVKVGWDAIVGLVPVVGDLATALVGVYPIHVARKHGFGKALRARMAGNLLLDWAVGEIPMLGDLFDVAFKANLKNLALLERAAEKRRKGRR